MRPTLHVILAPFCLCCWGELRLDIGDTDALHQSTIDCAGIGGSWSNITYTCTQQQRWHRFRRHNDNTSWRKLDKQRRNLQPLGLHLHKFWCHVYKRRPADDNQFKRRSGQVLRPALPLQTPEPLPTVAAAATRTIYSSGGTFTNMGTINNLQGGVIADLNSASTPGALLNASKINNNGFLQLSIRAENKTRRTIQFFGNFHQHRETQHAFWRYIDNWLRCFRI